jgi:membrane dipeptidase
VSLAAPFINRGRFSLSAQGDSTYSVRTLDLVRQSTVIDMLGLITLNYRKLSSWEDDPARFLRSDFLRLKSSGITALHPAVGYTAGDIYYETLRDITGWNLFLAAHPEQFLRVDRVADFERAKSTGKIGIVIGQQNSVHFRTVDDVDRFYALGQRVSQLTYLDNRIGGGSTGSKETGLTQYGYEVVERMNRIGMAVDISHCADRTSLDAIDVSKNPVLITHSNCRKLVPNSTRCKPDETIRQMAAKGGVMGLTMVRGFVSTSGPATIETVLDHVDHIAKLVGVEHAGVGTDVDLDGRDTPSNSPRKYDLDGIDYSKKIFDLTEGLVRRSYSNQDIKLILGGNFQRALSAMWLS